MNKKSTKLRGKPNRRTQIAIKLRRILFGQTVIVALLLLIQFSLYFIFLLRLQQFASLYFKVSIVLSVLFLIYLVNRKGKNEYKLAWLFPVFCFPVLGISLYFLFKYNQGGIWLKKKIIKIKTYSDSYIQEKDRVDEIQNKYPNIKDISQYLYSYGRYPAYEGTRTKYFCCGEDFFSDVLKSFEKAKKFIFMEFFIIEPSHILDRILEVLSKKVEEGVEVRILFDSIGSIVLSSSLLKHYFSVYGIKSKVWLKFLPVFNIGYNNRDHRKIIVVDNKTAYTGGVNISDEYANIESKRFDYWKDAGIKLSGPAVHSFTLMFLQMWNVQNKKNQSYDNFEKYISKKNVAKLSSTENLNNECGLVIPYGDDAYNNQEIAENVYYYLLNKAQKKVSIMTPYVIIDNTILDAMIFTAQRGVEVELIVPEHYDHFITFCVGRTFIKTLIESGVKVYAYQKGFIHSKVFVTDSIYGTVGSVNLDYRSFYHHFECGTFLYNTDSLIEAEKDFEKTKLECKEITLDEYKKISWYVRIIGWFFRIFSPLM